jgi:3-hydroxyisobutyrate dehydrogenase-like beta-hydroxyacid dehydrogenase
MQEAPVEKPDASTLRTVVFVGVGKMGLPMAMHLQAAGHRVTAFDRSDDRRQLAAAAGLPVAVSLAEALQALAPRTAATVGGKVSGEVSSDAVEALIISSLPDDAALLAVAEVLAARAPHESIWIDTSTVSPGASRAAAERVSSARGIGCLRAPVSGNSTMAERAALTVYVSGERRLHDACEAVFACWGPKQFWLGSGDEARVAKLVVNLLIVGTSTMLAEALALGEGCGLDRDSLWQVIEASAAASPIVKAKAPALRIDDYTPTFTVAQMRKDVALIRGAAQSADVRTPVADLASSALDRAAAAGAADLDYAVVIREARRPA